MVHVKYERRQIERFNYLLLLEFDEQPRTVIPCGTVGCHLRPTIMLRRIRCGDGEEVGELGVLLRRRRSSLGSRGKGVIL